MRKSLIQQSRPHLECGGRESLNEGSGFLAQCPSSLPPGGPSLERGYFRGNYIGYSEEEKLKIGLFTKVQEFFKGGISDIESQAAQESLFERYSSVSAWQFDSKNDPRTMPTPLHNQIAQPLLSDKLSQEKRLKAEIAQMRELAKIVREGKGTLVCEGPHGRCEVDQKEATLIDVATEKVLRNEPFKSHLYAVHRALCWAVMGMVESRFGEMK